MFSPNCCHRQVNGRRMSNLLLTLRSNCAPRRCWVLHISAMCLSPLGRWLSMFRRIALLLPSGPSTPRTEIFFSIDCLLQTWPANQRRNIVKSEDTNRQFLETWCYRVKTVSCWCMVNRYISFEKMFCLHLQDGKWRYRKNVSKTTAICLPKTTVSNPRRINILHLNNATFLILLE
jgi:hypothetical protein